MSGIDFVELNDSLKGEDRPSEDYVRGVTETVHDYFDQMNKKAIDRKSWSGDSWSQDDKKNSLEAFGVLETVRRKGLLPDSEIAKEILFASTSKAVSGMHAASTGDSDWRLIALLT